MGRINYHPARQAVIDHYTAPGTTGPALEISQADRVHHRPARHSSTRPTTQPGPFSDTSLASATFDPSYG